MRRNVQNPRIMTGPSCKMHYVQIRFKLHESPVILPASPRLSAPFVIQQVIENQRSKSDMGTKAQNLR